MNEGLEALFPDGDYRFRLTLRRASPPEFFAGQDASGRIRAERSRWLAADPARYAALQPEGVAVLDELIGVLPGWGVSLPEGASAVDPNGRHGGLDRMIRLGSLLEPDILLLSAGADGRYRLRGGALCFPTGWALEEKLGHTIDFIHDVVPGLNAALGPQIHLFLSKLKPGSAFLRDNWGLAATDELNLHPARRLAAPAAPVDLARLWLRVEHQALVALESTGGIVFGIRIALHRLDRLAGTPAGAGLRRALETMPAELAAYKRIEGVRDEVIARL